ncbi:hypothetical protein [Cellulomonas soli]|uniref:Uncharacterized protein n=1 Tax=Cellulomonas soli TaxID=931535 RepID=A0A512P957_9CELL|nr:hypothetical protein [Cellulomonas soli]NYI57956.1 hypothetical protein [Cellulomonas soli]GEP67739.1 hypothetical protein CSO01_04540 [Cellulomonas soli]
MAIVAFGHRLSISTDAVRYEFGLTADDPDRGVVVIPLDDAEAWFVEDRADRPVSAKKVVGRAWLQHERTGEWPEWASVAS